MKKYLLIWSVFLIISCSKQKSEIETCIEKMAEESIKDCEYQKGIPNCKQIMYDVAVTLYRKHCEEVATRPLEYANAPLTTNRPVEYANAPLTTNRPVEYANAPAPTIEAPRDVVPIIKSNLPICPAAERSEKWNNCFGRLVYSVGNEYVGAYKDGKMHGQGTFIFANGNKYVGEFRDDKINGQGTFADKNNTKYTGEWKDFKRHGKGFITFPDGSIHDEGIWIDDEFVGAE